MPELRPAAVLRALYEGGVEFILVGGLAAATVLWAFSAQLGAISEARTF